jgi:hypothetical protein
MLTLRVLASLLGGYLFVFGFTTLCVVLAVALGMPYAEAQTLAYLFSFLVFLVCFFWAFMARSLARVWAVLGGGGAGMLGAATWLSRMLA